MYYNSNSNIILFLPPSPLSFIFPPLFVVFLPPLYFHIFFVPDIRLIYKQKLCRICNAHILVCFIILENSEDHSVVIARREAIGQWLRNVIRKTLVLEDTDINYETKILLLLSGMCT